MVVQITNNGAMVFGSISLKSMWVVLNLKTLAASTYSLFFSTKNCPRITRATSTHIVSPTAIKTWNRPLPKTKVRAITRSKVGIDHITFISQDKTASIRPPKYPETAPTGIPMIKLTKTAMNPTLKLILLPRTTLEKWSRPNLSVPKKCVPISVVAPGPRRVPFKFMSLALLLLSSTMRFAHSAITINAMSHASAIF